MDVGRLAAWGVAALLAVLAVGRLLGGGSPAEAPAVAIDEPAEAVGAASGDGAASAGGAAGAGTAADRGGLHVHVAGAVRRPGLYVVPAGSRAAAAVDAAGGLSRRADPAGVNLAAALQDGQQVVVPERARGGGTAGRAPGAGAPAGGAAAGAGRISLSTATAEELETLDGIGPALAARIIEYREAHGGFRSVDELQDVDGIGEKRFAALRDAVVP